MSKVEFWRDPLMDSMIEDIIDIFHMEGVELVRLSGMTRRARNIINKHDLPPEAVHNIILKLKNSNIINFKHITRCPHCGETSYQIKCADDFLIKPKLCDTCNTLYALLHGSTLEE
jgi:hypothetical protein